VILATPKGNRTAFQAAFDSSLPIPRASQGAGPYSFSKRRVEMSDAVGVPAFMRAVRLICDTAAGFPINVFRGHGISRIAADDSTQGQLLRMPGGRDFTAQQIWSYAFASMLSGGAYFVKVKDNSGRVIQLLPIDPRLVIPKYKNGTMFFELRDKPNGRVKQRVGRETILYAAGILVDHPAIGVSIVQAFRNEIGTQLSR
jgi:phage portal protein BeeE